MGWSFRKSKSFGPFRLSFSKSGLGLSVGVKGARVSFGRRGTSSTKIKYPLKINDMLNGADVLHQEVISDNQKIFEAILANISIATNEILVATSWFTDDLLFKALLRKRTEGVMVTVIISDNQENEKLDFDDLVQKGGSVVRIKNVGYGTMHQKFCIIDRRIALHGSYNWSVNARNNNHESVIVTTHKQTVESLLKTFFEILDASTAMMTDGTQSAKVTPLAHQDEIDSSANSIKTLQGFDYVSEFTRILDSMIAAEVSNFDRDLLRKQGYERSRSNNGDAQVLVKAYDSVYSVFINEINVVEDKKKRLISKIEEQKARSILAIQESSDLRIATIETEYEAQEENLSKSILRLAADVAKNQNAIENNTSVKIPAIEEKNIRLKNEILSLQGDYVPPAWKLHEIIPITLLNVLLFAYLVLFYSSAAYILLFGEADAKEAQLKGLPVYPPEVFDPGAISKVLDKEGTAVLYIFLFVAIPIAFAIIKMSSNTVVSYIISFVLGILVLDTFLAYKVAKSIHDIEYLSGKVDTIWTMEMVFENPNFYMVFILGAMGLYVFKVTFDRLIRILDDRSPDEDARRRAFIVKERESDIEQNHLVIQNLKEEVKSIESLIIDMKAAAGAAEKEVQVLPAKRANQIEKLKNESQRKIQSVEAAAIVYKSHIENDDLPVSINSMKDRINIFLEGWNDFLYEEFANAKAKDKCAQAVLAATTWLDEKLKANIDRRINLN